AKADQAFVLHYLGPEAGVQQVHHGVLGTADVIVDRQPILNTFSIKCPLVVVRVGKAQEVPARASEAVHGIGFALGLAAALRTINIYPLLGAGQRAAAVAAWFVAVHLWQDNRQLIFWHGHGAALLAMDHRNRRAPVTLAA